MFGTTLKQLRHIFGYTGVEMSNKLDISNSYLSEIENNKKTPSLQLLQSYSKVFNIKLSTLILLSEKTNESRDFNLGEDFISNVMLNLISKSSKNS